MHNDWSWHVQNVPIIQSTSFNSTNPTWIYAYFTVIITFILSRISNSSTGDASSGVNLVFQVGGPLPEPVN